MDRFSSLLLAAACGLPLAASAGADDTMTSDRPDVVESSQVVGKGRLQLETSLQWERDRTDGATVRTLTMPTLLRIGLGETMELRFETDGRTIEHAGGATMAGYADTSVGIKWHTADQDGATPSLGWLLHADLPGGSKAFRDVAADRGGTQAVFDTGVTWLVTNDIQLDAAVSRGLNRRTPDLGIGLGLSVRR
ncbi:transporter [Massilia sp. CT11-108]|uniref:transporter n=1 Tax=Massilia sp. CT11-108 TaxID=3393900 RepID=UPI0039A41C11